MTSASVSKQDKRIGIALAVVLVALLVVTLLGAGMMRALVLHHRYARGLEDRQQAFWLAESAIERARHTLAAQPDYQGETWRVPAGDLAAGRAGVAIIEVQAASPPQRAYRIRVQVVYPDDPVYRVMYRQERLVSLPKRLGDQP